MITALFKRCQRLNTLLNKVVNVLFSHLGKVKEESDKEGLSLKPVADDLSKN